MAEEQFKKTSEDQEPSRATTEQNHLADELSTLSVADDEQAFASRSSDADASDATASSDDESITKDEDDCYGHGWFGTTDYSSDSDEEGNLREDRVDGRIYCNYGTGERYKFDEYRKAAEKGVAKQFGVESASEISHHLMRLGRHECCKIAADQGDAAAQLMLGTLLVDGDGVEQDYDTGIQYMEQAAKQGNGTAFNDLSLLYYEGRGVEQDHKKALEYLEQGSKLGCSIAQVNLAMRHFRGNCGVKQDYEKARHLLEKAAEQGEELAFNNLYFMYSRGVGVDVDQNKAVMYLKESLDRGHVRARQILVEESESGNERARQILHDYYYGVDLCPSCSNDARL